MNIKKIAGYLSLLIGIVLLCYGIYGSYRMWEAKEDIDEKTSYLPDGSVKGFVQKRFYGEVDQYKLPVTICYIGGAVFLVGGIFLLRFSKKN